MCEAFVIVVLVGTLRWIAYCMSSSRWRPKLIARFGERGVSGVYSLVALITFYSLSVRMRTTNMLVFSCGILSRQFLYLIAKDLNVR